MGRRVPKQDTVRMDASLRKGLCKRGFKRVKTAKYVKKTVVLKHR